MKIDHIGYLVNDIHKSIPVFEALGYHQKTEIYRDDLADDGCSSRNVFITFMENGSICVELVSPIDEKSDVFSTLKRQGEGPYHICYQTENLEKQVQELRGLGWMVLKRPAKAVALNNARVVFLFKRGAGLIELVEGIK